MHATTNRCHATADFVWSGPSARYGSGFARAVKPLDRLVRQSRVFAGFTILGDGKPALILDVNSLFDSVVEE